MEMLFLLKNLYRDPLALSRFSQFRCLHISKGEIIQNLNETHEFQVCFVLKGSLCLFRDHIESMPLMAMPVSYTHLRAHETDSYLVCRLLLEKKKKQKKKTN